MWFACAKTKRLMLEYADGGLAGRARGMFESHLDVCPGCRKEYEELRKVRALVASAPRFNAPAGFSARVMISLDSGRTAERHKAFLPGVMLMRTLEAALILVVIAAGIISGNFIGADLFSGGKVNNAGAAARQNPAGTLLSYSIEAFDPAPPESVGAAFVMTEDRNEK